MRKEELVLFPFIKEIEKVYEKGTIPLSAINISGPIAVMERDHEGAGKLAERLREITNDYTPQETACTTHRVTHAELKEFEENLHIHINPENNIHFPKALELEKELNNESGWFN